MVVFVRDVMSREKEPGSGGTLYHKRFKVHNYLMRIALRLRETSRGLRGEYEDLDPEYREMLATTKSANLDLSRRIIGLLTSRKEGIPGVKKSDIKRTIKELKKTNFESLDRIIGIMEGPLQETRDAIIELKEEIISNNSRLHEYNTRRDRLVEQMKANYASRHDNLAAAVFVVHSDDDTLPNSFIELKAPERGVTSFGDRSSASPQYYEISEYAGPVGLSSLNSVLYSHSEQNLLRHFSSSREYFKDEIFRAIEAAPDQYNISFIIYTTKNTCHVCNRSIRRFCQDFEQYLRSELRLPGISVTPSISYREPYGLEDDTILKIIDRILSSDENREILSSIAQRHHREFDLVSDRIQNIVFARLIEMGISHYAYAPEREVGAGGGSAGGGEGTEESKDTAADDTIFRFLSREQTLQPIPDGVTTENITICEIVEGIERVTHATISEEIYLEIRAAQMAEATDLTRVAFEAEEAGLTPLLSKSGGGKKAIYKTPPRGADHVRAKPTPDSDRKREEGERRAEMFADGASRFEEGMEEGEEEELAIPGALPLPPSLRAARAGKMAEGDMLLARARGAGMLDVIGARGLPTVGMRHKGMSRADIVTLQRSFERELSRARK